MFGRNDFTDRLRTLAEDLVELLTAQIRLARLELASDARAFGTRLARIALFVPLILLGYTFLMAAVVFALRDLVGWIAALVLVGGVNLVAGIVGCVIAARALEGVRILDRSRDEIERSVERVSAAAKQPGANPAAAASHLERRLPGDGQEPARRDR